MRKAEVVKQGMLALIMCCEKDATDEEILEAANEQIPCGTEEGWNFVIRNDENEDKNPVPCERYPEERVHFLVTC